MLKSGRASSIDGTQIAFSEWGNLQGPPVVLIHGWLFSRLAFERQTHGELAERCRIVAYDLRGHGESGKPESPDAYADGNLWAADLDCVLQAVGMERPVLAGWSLGGRVAAHYVFIRGPERVAGLNLVATRLLQPASTAVNRETNADEITSAASQVATPATVRFIRDCAHQPFAAEDEQGFLEVAAAVPRVAREGASAWHINYGNFFDGVALPVLVTHGDSDLLTSPVAAENIARRLRGTLSIYPNCGHMPFWENPLRFNHELADLVTRAR